jgi:hypothetical protein
MRIPAPALAIALAAALIAPASLARAATAAASPSEEFDRGRNAFARGEYRRAIDLLHPLLYPDVRLESEGEVVQAHRMLGVAYLFEDLPDDARREFRKLLELRPDYRFDPLLDPPRVVDFFNGVLREEEEEIASIEAKRRKREAELATRQKREADRLRIQQTTVLKVERHSLGVAFLPFGAGHFQNGDRHKGWLFLGTEAALAGASVAAFATNFALYGLAPHRRCLVTPTLGMDGAPAPCPPNEIDRSDETLSTNLLRVQVVTGGLFFAVAIWGIVDAIRHFREEAVIGSQELPPCAPAAAPGKNTSFRLSPSPLGLAATWRF